MDKGKNLARNFLKKRSGQTFAELEEIAKWMLIELFLYFFFLFSVTAVNFANKDLSYYYFKTSISRLYVERTFLRDDYVEIDFNGIANIQDLWMWMEASLVNGYYGVDDNNETEHHMGHLDEVIYLGMPRIRQLRVKNDTCAIPSYFKGLFDTCLAEFSARSEDTEDFQGSRYYKADELGALFIWGKYDIYFGGGYIQTFNESREETLELLSELQENLWIDSSTRLVVVEFNLYNPNVNLFCVVKFIAEVPPTGGIIPSAAILAEDLIFGSTAFDYYVIVITLFLFIQTVYYTVEEIGDIWEMKLGYFKSFWNYVDLILILLAYIYVIYLICRHFYMKQLINVYKENPTQYLSLDHISFFEFHSDNLLAICGFLAWMKVFKFMRFSKTLLHFTETLNRCAKDLFGFGIMFFIVFVAFAQLGYLLFGSDNFDFRTFSDSVFTMMRTILGDFDYLAIEKSNRVLGPLFFIAYIIFVFFILLNMFLAIINDTYAGVKSEIQQDVLPMGYYLKKTLANMCKYCWGGRELCTVRKPKVALLKDSDEAIPSTLSKLIQATDRETVTKYFQVDRDADLRSLNDRVKQLERLMDRIVMRLDQLVTKLEARRRR